MHFGEEVVTYQGLCNGTDSDRCRTGSRLAGMVVGKPLLLDVDGRLLTLLFTRSREVDAPDVAAN